MGGFTLKELESLDVVIDEEDKRFFSSDFFEHLINDFDDYVDIINSLNKPQRSTAAFGYHNDSIKELMANSLNNFLISEGELDIFNPRALFLKKSLDVTFQAAINYKHSSKFLFDVWELRLLFSKAGFKKYSDGLFYMYNVRDLDRGVSRFFSFLGRGGGKTFYSKFGAEKLSSEISDYLKNVPEVKKVHLNSLEDKEEEINTVSFPRLSKSTIIFPSLTYVRTKSDYLKSYEELYGGKDQEHYLNLVDKPLVDKIKGVYEAFDLDKFKIGKEIPEDKLLFFLDINFGKSADDFIPFINSKQGKAFIYHGGAPTDFFLKRVFSFKDKIYSVFKDEV